MKHSTIVALVILVVVSLSALASKPPVNLVVSTVTGGDGPSVQSIASSDSTQRVSIVNWLIDENGNLKVSNQVRDELHVLLDAPIMLDLGEVWQSDWIDARRFNVARFDVDSFGDGAHCQYLTSWFEGHEWADGATINGTNGKPSSRYDVYGPRIGVRCTGFLPYPAELRHVYLYLRAE